MKKLLAIILLLSIAITSVSAKGGSKSRLFNSIVNIIASKGTWSYTRDNHYKIQDKNSSKMRVEFKAYIEDAFILGSHYVHSYLDFKKLKSVKLEAGKGYGSSEVTLVFKKNIKEKLISPNGESIDWEGDESNMFTIYFDNEQDARKLYKLVEEFISQ